MAPYVRMSAETVKATDVMGTQVSVYQAVTMGGMEKNVIGNVLLIVKPRFVIPLQDVLTACLATVDLTANCVKEILMAKTVV